MTFVAHQREVRPPHTSFMRHFPDPAGTHNQQCLKQLDNSQHPTGKSLSPRWQQGPCKSTAKRDLGPSGPSCAAEKRTTGPALPPGNSKYQQPVPHRWLQSGFTQLQKATLLPSRRKSKLLAVLLLAQGSSCKPTPWGSSTSKALGAVLGAHTAIRNVLQTGCDGNEERGFGTMACNKLELKPLLS